MAKTPNTTPKQETAVTQLAPHRMQLAEERRNVHHVNPEQGTPPEALLDSKYWAHVAPKLRPRDRIEVDAEDGAYFAELMVLDVGRMYVKVELMRVVNFKANQTQGYDLGEFEVKWRGATQKWCAVRKDDRAVMRDGFETATAAELWTREHLKALAA